MAYMAEKWFAKQLIQLLVLFGCTILVLADRGNYTISGLETNTLTADYTYGDGKSSDSANFGIFKQNWFMLRTSTLLFKRYTTAQYNDGAILNTNLTQDIKTRHESESYYGTDVWFAGHRNGESSVNDPDTQDIANYRAGVAWIHDQLAKDEKYLTDNTRFWYSVVPI
ncbi:hypothetical protein CU098_010193 [Rhizopus stolonifer]|uniref:Uncharacterized protein n=1 Tax=Rhizopus stolonifer TaxID=4846 RepID=A0A367JRL1_RHIST|nr:hypothetical protein CU098_010193 [Rhizopus stolonifer]